MNNKFLYAVKLGIFFLQTKLRQFKLIEHYLIDLFMPLNHMQQSVF